MTLQIFLHFFSSQVCNIPPIHVAALSPQRIADALLTSRLCLSLPHIATPANGASEMRYSLETPFVRSAAEDAWGYRRPTHPALRRCATTGVGRWSAARTRFQLTPDSASGDRVEREICTAWRCRCRCSAGVRQRRRVRGACVDACAPDAVGG